MCRLGEEYTSCTEQMTGPIGEPFEETWREYGWQGKKKTRYETGKKPQRC